MSKHDQIELIILTVCSYFGIDWQDMYFRPKGKAMVARSIVIHLYLDLISPEAISVIHNLNFTTSVVFKTKNDIVPLEYYSFRQSLINKIAA